MKSVITKIMGVASVLMLGAGQAFAGHRSYGPPPQANKAPEIDPVQGVAALAILICVGLVVREKFFRQKPATN